MQKHDYKKYGFIPQRQLGRLIMRIRSRGGNLTSAELRKVADLADSYGQSLIHVTTRQALEMPGVEAECFEKALHAVKTAGLLPAVCGARVRPIVACPGTDACPYPKNGELFAAFVAENKILAYLNAIMMTYHEVAEKGERLGAVVARLGLARFESNVRNKLMQPIQ